MKFRIPLSIGRWLRHRYGIVRLSRLGVQRCLQCGEYRLDSGGYTLNSFCSKECGEAFFAPQPIKGEYCVRCGEEYCVGEHAPYCSIDCAVTQTDCRCDEDLSYCPLHDSMLGWHD